MQCKPHRIDLSNFEQRKNVRCKMQLALGTHQTQLNRGIPIAIPLPFSPALSPSPLHSQKYRSQRPQRPISPTNRRELHAKYQRGRRKEKERGQGRWRGSVSYPKSNIPRAGSKHSSVLQIFATTGKHFSAFFFYRCRCCCLQSIKPFGKFQISSQSTHPLYTPCFTLLLHRPPLQSVHLLCCQRRRRKKKVMNFDFDSCAIAFNEQQANFTPNNNNNK